MQITELSPEPWVAMGYYCLATNRASRSVFFAQKVIFSFFSRFLSSFYDNQNDNVLSLHFKAHLMDVNGAESLLLKGLALKELNKIQDAALHFKEAMKLDPTRFEVYKG